MISGSRKNRPMRPFTWLLLLGAVAFAAGCSSANNTGGGAANHVLPSGSSVPGWTVSSGGSQHAISAAQEYASGGTLVSCTECHGSDLRGGISRTSCFANPAGCHHGTITGATTGEWVDVAPAVQQHGVWAKRAIGDGSFFACRICHGSDFSGGGAQVTCFNNAGCHGAGVFSPHPPAPWRGGVYTHTNTDTSNAPVCAQCHRENPGTPGCFNSTLCHGTPGAPHPVGATWVATAPAAQPHGNDAKATLGATTGFSYCQDCHGAGTDFAGGSSLVSCYPCHGVSAPHAPAPWRASAGSSYTHTTTVETGNAAVCAFCHFPGSPNNPANHPPTPAPAGTPPGCFNSTLCHGAAQHPAGWELSSQHGPAAKALPSASGGFSFCQACHGTGTTSPANFGGGSVGGSCYTCHGVNAPHPNGTTWVESVTPSHRNTNQGQANVDVCGQCHRRSPDPNPAEANGCFNNTLCHGT